MQGVHKLQFGVPEAMWVIEVKDFPAVVTMDAHGDSLHAAIERQSKTQLDRLLAMPL
ncbi:MAG TPA: fumarate hydratase C-terminal domain-containing protein [Anaerolineae bacterium]|nr:fumarate hydratase C-terminal domain-containing protein [Anaerolineae bacterium]